jgi:hypothetical protein
MNRTGSGGLPRKGDEIAGCFTGIRVAATHVFAWEGFGMRRLLLVGGLVAALAGPAEALTIRDIIELTRAGLGDEVLLALIEVDRAVYAIDNETLKQLKTAGVSDRVIVALVRSGREVPVEPLPLPATDPQSAEPPAPQVVVIDHQPERIVEVPVPVAVPVFVPSRRFRHHGNVDRTFDASNFVPFQTGPLHIRPIEPPKLKEPVYWGFGGKLRPDAWDPGVKQPDRRK